MTGQVDGGKKYHSCAETVQGEAKVCRFCGHQFEVAVEATPGDRELETTSETLLFFCPTAGVSPARVSGTDDSRESDFQGVAVRWRGRRQLPSLTGHTGKRPLERRGRC